MSKDYKIPVGKVVFIQPMFIKGLKQAISTVIAGSVYMEEGREFKIPGCFFDPVHRMLVIGDREYPVERVAYWERDWVPEKQETPDYTIGKRRFVTNEPRIQKT